MILADTSVWVDYLRGADSTGAIALERAIGSRQLVLGDLIVAEILRGVSSESAAELTWSKLRLFDIVTLGGVDIAIAAAQNYRFLRSKAITIRGTIDLIIATWCIKNDVPLLHSDRDFREMEKWLGLKSWA
jgi:predicted nucleic acid-binding protein